MKCLILAAGYATRLYPLTENFPKPLLKVQNKTILDWLIDDIDREKEVEEYFVVTNSKYYPIFQKWATVNTKNIVVVDDGTFSNETRLGAVKDILFSVEHCKIDDDLLVIAGDNLLNFSLTKFISYTKEKKASCVMRYFEPSVEKLKKCGVIDLGEEDKIARMTEKPQNPTSNWCCPPFYFYTKSNVKLLSKAIEEGCGVDAPGSFISWLSQKDCVYAMEMPGKRYDIGTLESYERVQKEYQGYVE